MDIIFGVIADSVITTCVSDTSQLTSMKCPRRSRAVHSNAYAHIQWLASSMSAVYFSCAMRFSRLVVIADDGSYDRVEMHSR